MPRISEEDLKNPPFSITHNQKRRTLNRALDLLRQREQILQNEQAESEDCATTRTTSSDQ